MISENFGYRAGKFDKNSPAERLKDRGIGMLNSKVGLLGTGYYFVGDKKDAIKLQKSVEYESISEIDLSKYNLYKPSDPSGFYENIKSVTYYINGLEAKDLKDPKVKENIKDAIEVFSEFLNIDKKTTSSIFKEYIKDVINRKDGDLLSNRLLYQYDGIDLTETPYDDFGAGSLIFNGKLKPNTYREITEIDEINKRGFNPKLGNDPFGLTQYARELSKGLEESLLIEVGEGTSPYPYKKVSTKKYGDNETVFLFEFTTDTGLEYTVSLSYNLMQRLLKVTFFVGEGEFTAVNKGIKEAFRVISTVQEIIKKEIQPNIDIQYIRFEPAKGKANDPENLKGSEQRNKLYTAYIKKSFPQAEVNQVGGSMIIKLNEEAIYSNYINYKQHIKDLTKYFLKKYPNIKQTPKVIFKHNDVNNATNFFGKTAYYDPNTKTIVLYTEGRHPKDIVRSYSHEYIHFIQDMENRLGDISTQNTTEDDHLQNIEKEAYLEGNITFRNWADDAAL
jgi:hypothetical protein